jgi:two-component system sensor histidine kinase AlgZ
LPPCRYGLALIAFCVHAVAVYYLSLQRAQLHLAQAQADARDAELRALRLQVNPAWPRSSIPPSSSVCTAWEALHHLNKKTA